MQFRGVGTASHGIVYMSAKGGSQTWSEWDDSPTALRRALAVRGARADGAVDVLAVRVPNDLRALPQHREILRVELARSGGVRRTAVHLTALVHGAGSTQRTACRDIEVRGLIGDENGAATGGVAEPCERFGASLGLIVVFE